jgi:hypothetical protein
MTVVMIGWVVRWLVGWDGWISRYLGRCTFISSSYFFFIYEWIAYK